MNKKMEEVKEANVRVVSEDFLQDISTSTKSLQELLSTHLLSCWGAEVKAEPVEAVAPKGKSGAVLSKKSKGPVKEEGEAPSRPTLPWPHPAGGRGLCQAGQVRLCTASPFAPELSFERCPHQFSHSFSLGAGWCEAAHRCHVDI